MFSSRGLILQKANVCRSNLKIGSQPMQKECEISVNALQKNVINIEYTKQLIKSSSSVAGNYIEASHDLGRADEKSKIKVAQRDVKEAKYFLSLMLTYDDKKLEEEKNSLTDESGQIQKILSAILKKLP